MENAYLNTLFLLKNQGSPSRRHIHNYVFVFVILTYTCSICSGYRALLYTIVCFGHAMMTYAVNQITFAIVSLTIFQSTITSGSKKNDDLSLDNYFASIPDTNVRNLTRLLFSVCPDFSVCGSMTKSSFNDTFRCCDASCSCDMDCHTTQSCCPHIWHTMKKPNVTEELHYKCQRAVILNRLDSGRGEEYFFVTSCPQDYDLVVKKACERTIHNETFTFGDVTPVSVQSDGAKVRNYFNRHCAACNKVAMEDMVVWTPRIL